MTSKLWLIASAAAIAAAPATAQNNDMAAPPDNTVNVVTTDINAADPINMANVAEPIAAPPAESNFATRADADDDDDERGFPWGLIGLVGLIGLLGRRRRD